MSSNPYVSPYETFVFEDYSFDINTHVARFRYSFDGVRMFTETVEFTKYLPTAGKNSYDIDLLDAALRLSFYLAGTSYYKAFPTTKVLFKAGQPDQGQADFLQTVYTQGLSQFIFENGLTVENIAVFSAEGYEKNQIGYSGTGALVLQSGGKDSLLLASLLEEKEKTYTPWYVGSSSMHPGVLDTLASKLSTANRQIDIPALTQAGQEGALNGHVPVTYIVLSYALIAAILQNKNTILASIGAEGGEAHEFVGELAVNHQWSKTWEAEQLLANYVKQYISADIKIGSPLRQYSELAIAKQFATKAWDRFGQEFSSCNRANYEQGADNQKLRWCGECPKCANSYLLFAPFVEPAQLKGLFGGQDLFAKPLLNETFKGLLGIDGVMKPFECIGEVGELRLAYHMAKKNFGSAYADLPFDVPTSNFKYKKLLPSQAWAKQILATV